MKLEMQTAKNRFVIEPPQCFPIIRYFLTKKNRLLFLISFSFLSTISYQGHSQDECATMEYFQEQAAINPSLKNNLSKIDAMTQGLTSSVILRTIAANEILTIPVVVHIVYNTSEEIMSEAQVVSQIEVLNQDFRRTNLDRLLSPPAFAAVAGDALIEFRLAGITYTKTAKTSFRYGTEMKFTSTGGKDAWDTKRYLNIWVCDLGTGLGGFASFPGAEEATDGVVVNYRSFGYLGSATGSRNLGRATTHEVGHWLNLRHIWGDENGCSGSDFVDDTPNQAGYRKLCPTFPSISCSNGPNGDMFMNYMDYTSDKCMNMFSKGQVDRMRKTFSLWRASTADRKGLAMFSLNVSSKMAPSAILPEGDLAGAWRYSSSNTVHGLGDFDGNGFDDVLVSSEWGIGILYNNGKTWTSLVAQPNGTRFGGWLYSSHENTISGIGDFNNDGKSDILITSPWGIGILTMSGNTLTSLMLAPNGTLFGGWRYNGGDNIGKDVIQQIADFNGDHNDDILLTSIWGIGALTFNGTTLTSLAAQPNGTRFGGWLFGSSVNTINGSRDFNGDVKDDFVVTSAWGIGILTLSGSTFTTLMLAPKDTWFGGWRYNASVNVGQDKIQAVADCDGDLKADLLITSSWGIGVLTLNGTSLTSLVAQPNGTRFGGWMYNSSVNTFLGAARFNRNAKSDFIVKSPWGLGILELSGSTFTSLDLNEYGSNLGRPGFGRWYLAEKDNYNGLSYYRGVFLLKAAATPILSRMGADSEFETGNLSFGDDVESRLKIYPNPFQNNMTIKFVSQGEMKMSITLYNNLSVNVKDILVNQSISAGEQQIDLDLSELPSGVYSVNISSDSFRRTEKVIKTK